MLNDFGHVKFMYKLMSKIIDRNSSVSAMVTHEWNEGYRHVGLSVYPSENTYAWFYSVYNVNENELNELCDVIDLNYDGSIGKLSHPTLETIYAVDNGYQEFDHSQWLSKLQGIEL
jgi:hypothetical protein